MFILNSGWINEYGVNFSYINTLKFNKEYWGKILLTYLNTGGLVNVNDYHKIPTFSKTSKDVNEDDFKNGNAIYVTSVTSGGKVDVDTYIIDENRVSLSNIIDVDRTKIQFKTKNGIQNFYLRRNLDENTHFAKDFDDKLIIDFNDLNLKIFLKSTSDLFTIKRNEILEITRNLFCEKCFRNPFTKDGSTNF